MRGARCLVILLILLPLGQCALSSPLASGATTSTTAHPQISEVLPRFPSEHIGIVNAGGQEIDLKGWAITDGEGWWTFIQETRLPSYKELIVGPNATFIRLVHSDAIVLDIGEVSKKGRLILADDGDEVILQDSLGNIVDMVAYGKSSYSGIGWQGEKCLAPPEGKALRRSHLERYSDTDTNGDWCITTLGRSSFRPLSAECSVEPFLCPEDMRDRILREIAFAHVSISLEVYILSDPSVIGALALASQEGVEVRVLVEGEPVGGLTASQASLLSVLSRSGCQVLMSVAFHGFKRYDYHHPKFMVVDGRRVLLASENFAYSSLDNNRGWGVCLEDRGLATAFLAVFEKDADVRYPDIRRVSESTAQGNTSLPVPGSSGTPAAPDSFSAVVETVLAPDFGYRSVMDLIRGARERLDMELYYFNDQWPPDSDIYLAVIDAARRGVSVRLLLDGNWYNNEEGKGNSALAEALNGVAEREGLDLKAKTLSPFHDVATLHNKGAVADDMVLIGSINWVRASFERNREVGVILQSKEVAEFFLNAFQEDWVDDAIPPELDVPSHIEVNEGKRVVLNANASDNSGSVRVLWDMNGDGTIEGEGPFFVSDVPVGVSLIRITALDPSNNTCVREVRVTCNPSTSNETPSLAVVAIPLAIIVLWSVRKRVKRK